MIAVDAKAELDPNLLTSHHIHVSPHSPQRFIQINSQISMTARWYYLCASMLRFTT
jgi:hypothetical protein